MTTELLQVARMLVSSTECFHRSLRHLVKSSFVFVLSFGTSVGVTGVRYRSTVYFETKLLKEDNTVSSGDTARFAFFMIGVASNDHDMLQCEIDRRHPLSGKSPRLV